MKGIERSAHISTHYLSEIDEALISSLNSCPPCAIGAFVVLHFSDVRFLPLIDVIDWILDRTRSLLVLHGLIFRFICDDIQQKTLHSFALSLLISPRKTLAFDFFSNPQPSQHHAVNPQTHNFITERCFSYILNRRLTHFLGIHHWASKSKHSPWLWRLRKPKGAITYTLSEFRWRRKEHIGCHKELEPFWALVLALKYLPYLLNKATGSEELIGLAKMWSYRYPLLVSLFPRDTKRAGKAVETYLSRFDRKRQRESEIAVSPPLLSNV